jgi:hypothetical protein
VARKKPASWQEQAEIFKAEETLPFGAEREALERKARPAEDSISSQSQLKIASHLNQWISSPELQPPK